MGGLCFQVLGSLGVFGVLGVLGVFVFKTPYEEERFKNVFVKFCGTKVNSSLV